ncbi:MAG: hypothetical protein DME00_19660 [Candidatus Rokuibacteriota bacterium]|nr:MAG: hypothetical protein DME00_19660 [Candidatus Rokubacteria bacterium]
MSTSVWLIPLFPLVGALLNMIFGRVIGRYAHWIALPALAGSFVASCVLFSRVASGETFTATLFPWVSAGDFETSVAAYVDPLTGIMLLVVTGVGALIHLYSVGYMHDDPGYPRYFAYLNLFVFSMTMLVLAGNFLLLYVFWEAVGLCSYLLIGFWYTRPAASQAGKKAFIVNRVGDFGFGLGIMWLWSAVGTLDYDAAFAAISGVEPSTATGTIGLVQTDIKRVLAYSTVSQLGYMFAAVGVGAYAAGIFHLVTHAFFKALLFLGAGSVIHGLGGEQDLRKMGGLSSRMVATTITTTIGGLGLAGLPGLSGFFSKDEILAAAYGSGHKGMWALLLLGAFLTSFYTSRMLFLAFYSGPRMTKEAAHHVHESPGVMTLPLWILTLLTVITGIAFGIPSEHGTRFERFLAPVFPVHESGYSGVVALLLLLSAVTVFVAGVVVAWSMYMATGVRAGEIGRPRNPIHALLLNAYYVDALYDRAIVRPLLALFRFLAGVFDLSLIDGLVNAVGRTVVACAAGLRRIQTGYTVNYALTMLAGAVAIVAFLLSR